MYSREHGLWHDQRLFRTPRWSLDRPKDWMMLVPQELLNCVAFLGQHGEVGGTAFFARGGAEEPHQVYLVTASHCVWDFERDEPRTGLFVRLDLLDGTHDVQLPDGDKWWLHPTNVPTVDIAVFPWDASAELSPLGYRWVPPSMFFSEDILGDDVNAGVGVGDEVVALGLFHIYSGKHRNEAMVRTGNIAMIPAGPVNTNESFGPMRVYLVELRSIGGMSGSPVFVRHRSMIGSPSATISLLGVLLGHYPEQSLNIGGAAVNMGIGMVAPAAMLEEVLNQGGLVERRTRKSKEAREHRGEAVADAATPKGKELTKSEFEDILQRVTRKVEPRKGEG